MRLTPSYRVTGWRLAVLLVVLVSLIVLAGCRSRRPEATPTPAGSAAQDESLPENESTALVNPESGGSVRLRNGADIAVPAQAVSAQGTLTLRTGRE